MPLKTLRGFFVPYACWVFFLHAAQRGRQLPAGIFGRVGSNAEQQGSMVRCYSFFMGRSCSLKSLRFHPSPL